MTEHGDGLSLEEAAARHGAYLWVERRLFELTGAWTGVPGIAAAARIHLFEASARHAWHAELWRERLPLVAGFDVEAIVRPWSAELDAALGAIAPPHTAGAHEPDELALMGALCTGILPRLVRSYRAYLDRASETSDAPGMRVAALVVRDEEEEIDAGSAVLRELGTDRAHRAHTGPSGGADARGTGAGSAARPVAGSPARPAARLADWPPWTGILPA